MPAERHDVDVSPSCCDRDEREDDRDGDREDRDDRARDVPEEDQDDDRDDDDLLDQLRLQRVDGALDEVRAVVGRHDLHALRQRRLDVLQLRLDPLDDVERVLAAAHHDDAADDLALAVEVGDAAADLGAERDPADVADRERRAALVRLEDDLLDVARSIFR